MDGLEWGVSEETVALPFSIFNSLTARSGTLDEPCEELDGAALPKLEKFHVPLLPWMSGPTATPMARDFAWRNGAVLKLGSSAIWMLSALRLPEKIEKLR